MKVTRRGLFPALLGASLAPAAMQQERAFAAVVPICPKCGLHVYFTERFDTEKTHDYAVRCPCGWIGVSPLKHAL